MSPGVWAVALILGGWAALWLWLRSRDIGGGEPQDQPDRPYRAYTRAFDLECTGLELAQTIVDQALVSGKTGHLKGTDPAQRLAEFTRAYSPYSPCSQHLAQDCAENALNLSQTAIVVLLDQSGSMAKVMPRVAGELAAFADRLERCGANVMVAGFTTVGWKGGRSRQKWVKAGKPPYPGRLCDLLHIVYKDFDAAVAPDQFEPLIGAVLFENVDGEALRWARQNLEARAEPKKLLIVVSDGAPVDDSTLQENGSAILDRDIRQTIREIETDQALGLGAIGIGFDVSRYYSISDQVSESEPIAPAMAALVRKLAKPA